jgi:translation initiation factor IF-2
MMDLKSSNVGHAKGYVLETKLEKGRGPVATLLCQKGLLHVGDYFKCGVTSGKVTSIVDSHGQRISEVKPGVPVLVAGFDELANAGDYFEVISQEEYKKVGKVQSIAEYKQSSTLPTAKGSKGTTINILFKADSNSSKEAVMESLHKMSKKLEKKFNVVFAGVGAVAESDIEFAATTKSAIYTLHVKAEPNAVLLAHKLGVAINYFDIIYKLLERLEAVAEGAKEVKKVRTKIGEATVRVVFNVKGIGVIAGSYVNDGRFSKDGTVIIMRGRKKVGEGPIKSLQRDKKSVKEVHSGYECGFLVEGFNDWEVDDKVECYLEIAETPAKK